MVSIAAPIIFQVVKLVEKAITGRKKGKDKKKLAKGMLKAAFEILDELKVLPDGLPTFEEVEDQIETAVLGIKAEQRPTLLMPKSPDTLGGMDIHLTVKEFVAIIAEASKVK